MRVLSALSCQTPEEEAIITDPMKVVATLNSVCVEMDNRYALLNEPYAQNQRV